jgi:probable HAF family extracellular repeat protein
VTISLRSTASILSALVALSCSGADAVGVSDGLGKSLSDGAKSSAYAPRVDLGTLGGASSYAADISGADVVVGWSETSSGRTHAFRWTSAQGMVDLGTLSGDEMSKAVSVLDGPTGDVLGVSGTDGRWTPVIWSASGTVRALTIPLIPNFTIALPTAFNARGDVVGSDAGAGEHGWIWSESSGKYDLSAHLQGATPEGSAADITSSGLVVLTTGGRVCQHDPTCWRTFLWKRTSGYLAIGLPGVDQEMNVVGLGVNETGTVVGWLASNGSGASPYRWVAGEGFTALANYSATGSSYGYGAAINSSGTIAGADLEPVSGSIVASAWLANGSIVRLSPDDPNPSVAVAINDPGTIAGWAAVADGVNHAVLWKASGAPSGSGLRVPSGVASRVSSASSGCLADARSITSRQALFSCVSAADWSAAKAGKSQ